jgi:uncharacterized protein (TIGR00730 family)
MPSLAVFCGARTGSDAIYQAAARESGEAIAGAKYRLVYGGGRVGLMGILADAALANGGEVIGVIPQALATTEVAHYGLSFLHVVSSMHERKALIADLSDGFIALPGGIGTLDEFCEMLTWQQLRIHEKPMGLLNTGGYYDQFIAFLDHSTSPGFTPKTTREALCVAPTIAELLDLMKGYLPK